MDLKKIVKEEMVKFLDEYGAPSYTEEEIRKALSPFMEETVNQIIKAKNNYFQKNPASFYGLDMKGHKGEEVELFGKDIINYVVLTLKGTEKSNISPYKEAITFLETFI